MIQYHKEFFYFMKAYNIPTMAEKKLVPTKVIILILSTFMPMLLAALGFPPTA